MCCQSMDPLLAGIVQPFLSHTNKLLGQSPGNAKLPSPLSVSQHFETVSYYDSVELTLTYIMVNTHWTSSEVRVVDKWHTMYSCHRGLWNVTYLRNFLEWKSGVFLGKAGFYSLFGSYFSPRHHDLNCFLFPWPLSTFMLSNTAHVSMKFNKFEFPPLLSCLPPKNRL